MSCVPRFSPSYVDDAAPNTTPDQSLSPTAGHYNYLIEVTVDPSISSQVGSDLAWRPTSNSLVELLPKDG